MPTTSACSSGVLLQRPLTVLVRQTRQAVHVINQSIFKYKVYANAAVVNCTPYNLQSTLTLSLPFTTLHQKSLSENTTSLQETTWLAFLPIGLGFP